MKIDLINKHVELNTFLKIKHLASTGGQVKLLIRSGQVSVNGQVENRNRRKLVKGDVVVVSGNKLVVDSEVDTLLP